MEEESSLLILDTYDDENNGIQDCDVMTVNSTLSILSLFQGKSFDWEEIYKGNENLETAIKGLQTILSADNFVRFSKENLKDILKIIQAIISESISNKHGFSKRESPKKMVAFASTPRLPSPTFNQFEEKLHKDEIEHLNLLVKSLQTENKSLQTQLNKKTDELENYISENSDCLNRKLLSQIDINGRVKQLNAAIADKDEKILLLNDKLKLSESIAQKLETDLESQIKENTNLNVQYLSMKFNLDKRNNQYNHLLKQYTKLKRNNKKLESIITSLKVEVNDAKAKYAISNTLIDQESAAQLMQENSSLNRSIVTVSELYKKEVEISSTLRKEQELLRNLVRKQNNLIDELDVQTERLNQKNIELNISLNEYKEINIKELESDMNRNQNIINDFTNQFNEIVKILNEETDQQFKNTSDVTEYLRQFIHHNSYQAILNKNKNLIKLAGSLIKFYYNLVLNGKIDQSFIKISEDVFTPEIRESIQQEFAKARKFLYENSINMESFNDEIETILIEVVDQMSFDKDSSIVIAAQSQLIRHIRIIDQRIIKNDKHVQNQFAEIAERLGYVGRTREMADSILQKLDELSVFKEKVSNKLECDNVEDVLKELEEYQKVYNALRSDLLPQVEFNGELCDLPIFAADLIKSLSQSIEFHQNNSKDIQEKMRELKTSFVQEKEEHGNTYKRTTRLIKKLSNEIETLKHQNNVLQKAADEAEEKFQKADFAMHKMDDILRENVNHLQALSKENESLQELCETQRKSNERQAKNSEARIKEFTEKQAILHKDSINALTKAAERRESELKMEIGEQKKQISQIKRMMKEIISKYEDAFIQQKATTEGLRAQNEELIKMTLENNENSKPNNNPILFEELESTLKFLREEKEKQEDQMKSLNEEHSRVLKDRDCHWRNIVNELEERYTKEMNDLQAEISGLRKKQSLLEEISNELCPEASSPYEAIKKLASSEKRDPIIEKEAPATTRGETKQQEWGRWARDVVSSVDFMEDTFGKSEKELRNIISNIVFSSVGNRILAIANESLKTQKRILQHFDLKKEDRPKYAPTKFRSIFVLVMGLTRMRYKRYV